MFNPNVTIILINNNTFLYKKCIWEKIKNEKQDKTPSSPDLESNSGVSYVTAPPLQVRGGSIVQRRSLPLIRGVDGRSTGHQKLQAMEVTAGSCIVKRSPGRGRGASEHTDLAGSYRY